MQVVGVVLVVIVGHSGTRLAPLTDDLLTAPRVPVPTRAGGDTRSVKNPTSPLGVGGLDAIFVRYQLLRVIMPLPQGRGLPLPKPLPGCFWAVIEMHHDFFRGVFFYLMLASFFVACLIFACPRMRASEDPKMAQNEAFQGPR